MAPPTEELGLTQLGLRVNPTHRSSSGSPRSPQPDSSLLPPSQYPRCSVFSLLQRRKSSCERVESQSQLDEAMQQLAHSRETASQVRLHPRGIWARIRLVDRR